MKVMAANFSMLAWLGLFSVALPGPGRAESYAWETMLPDSAAHHGLVEFSGAVEAKNGDLLVAGQDGHGEYLARLQPDGKLRWLGQSAYPSGSGSVYIGIHETDLGIATLWGCCAEPGWTATLYGDGGVVASRVDLGYPRGNLDVTRSATVVFLTNQSGAGGAVVSVEGHSLRYGDVWKASYFTAGGHDEAIGVHAVGDSCVAVLDRMGGLAGDTLMAMLLDGPGKVLWSSQVPTGVKATGYPDIHSILWSHISHDSSGRIVLAGIVENPAAEHPVRASMALAVFSSAGNLLWLKRFPLGPPGDTVSVASRKILSLAARSQGIRVCLSYGGPDFWSTRDIPWSGESEGTFFDTPPLDVPSMYMLASPTPGGSFIGFGSTSPQGGIVAHASMDPSWNAAGMAYPVLFGPVPDSGKKWSGRRIPEYADTVWVQTQPSTGSPTGSTLLQQTAGPGLYFLLPTQDGGAVTGGRLWRRNGGDTLSVIAIKIPPGEINALPLRPAVIRAKTAEKKGTIPFDAAGRSRRKAHGPAFFYRP